MIRLRGLGLKIAVRMSLVTLAGLAISVLCTFFLYTWVFENHPDAVAAPHDWIPQTIDWLVVGGSLFVAVAIAAMAGMQLARRIIFPLTSLAEAARRITEGDLSARAAVGDRSLGETAVLVDDFNTMAARMETLADDMVIWNASIAHELRTPVTILKGRLQGVWDGVFEMDEATLTSLLRQVDGLARLVEDLRIVSLADSGRLSLLEELVDLGQIVGELREAVEPGLLEAGFHPEWRLDSVVTVCDPVRLRQATLVLIENARVHASPGVLRIGTRIDGGTARIWVEDRGPGLPIGFERRAFDPFQRQGRQAAGSGLGLAVVRAIAEAHRGLAVYRLAPDGGSIFEIEFPVTTETSN